MVKVLHGGCNRRTPRGAAVELVAEEARTRDGGCRFHHLYSTRDARQILHLRRAAPHIPRNLEHWHDLCKGSATEDTDHAEVLVVHTRDAGDLGLFPEPRTGGCSARCSRSSDGSDTRWRARIRTRRSVHSGCDCGGSSDCACSSARCDGDPERHRTACPFG